MSDQDRKSIVPDPLQLASDSVKLASDGVKFATDSARVASIGLRKSQRRLRRLILGNASRKTGLPPGTLVYTGEEPIEDRHEVNVVVHLYDDDGCEVIELSDIADLARLRQTGRRMWVDIDGVHDLPLLEAIGKEFGIHPLVLEDIARSGQRARVEEYGGYVFLVLAMLRYADEDERVDYEQVSMVLGDGWLLSFQERQGDVFQPLRQRLTARQSPIHSRSTDYLMYRLLDITVDHYFVVLERLGDQVAELEDGLLRGRQDNRVLAGIHTLKQESLLLRRAVWPLRELLAQLERRENPLVDAETRVYIRDVYSHAVEVIETIETIRDLISGMLDVHLTNVNNRMNEVMKVLTIISTIFVPLTFIVGIYGMNFTYMPELQTRWAYPAVWAVMIALTAMMLIIFRRKRWL